MSVPQIPQFCHVFAVNFIEIGVVHFTVGIVSTTLLLHVDGLADHNVHSPSIWHETDIVVEDPSRVEERDCESHGFLENHLELVDVGMLFAVDLFVELVLAEGEYWHKIGAETDGEFDEPFAGVEDQAEDVRLCIERFARAAHDDGHGTAHTLTVDAALAQQVDDTFFGHRCEAESEQIVTVEGNAKVRVQSQEGIGDAGEEIRKAQSFGAKCSKGSVTDDTVGMIAKDVLSAGLQLDRSMQAGGIVGCKGRPELASP